MPALPPAAGPCSSIAIIVNASPNLRYTWRTCPKLQPGFWSTHEHEVDRSAQGQDLRGWRGREGDGRDVCQAVRQRVHDEPDADAQGRYLRLQGVRARG